MAKAYRGLTEDEVLASREKHGTNELEKIPVKGILRRFFENLSDPIIRVLLIALLLQVIFTFGNTNFIEVFGIVAAILIATVVSTISEYGSERAFAKIEAETSHRTARVIRGGKTIIIPSSMVVVGDILLLASGDSVEADGIIIDGAVDVDQSALNGENREVHKVPTKNSLGWELGDGGKVFRGSVVTSGEAVMRVGRVGGETFYGMVARDVQAETRVSPLKLRLSKLAGQISILGYIVAAIVGLTFMFNAIVADNGFRTELILVSLKDTKFLLSTALRALTMMITVIVVAVPEGLPMMITVVLSANMKRMVKDNILVKKMVGIETAGSLNILFTDKTGTLTEGKLSLERVITEDKTYRNIESLSGKSGAQYDYLLLSAGYNTDAERTTDGIIGGNSTDRAIAEFFYTSDIPIKEIKGREPFSSDKKYSSVTLDGGITLIKGAPEVILPRCKYALKSAGITVATDLSYVTRQLNEAISRGERVIAVAMHTGGDTLTFVALMVLKDKVRTEVKSAVKRVQKAGIQIVMLTGDNKETAAHIAEECGFYNPAAGHIILTSAELAKMSDEEIKSCLPRLRILSRALPRDKSRLVRLSQELELVVGMTGDGINDAPSLKLADVGFAMGSGTDIAKGAGDIVVLDDSFNSIAKTILYGRTIFKSIRKFITFQLIMNLAACGITLIGQFIGIDNPITIIQMLWVNIIMDTLGGLAFAGEPPLEYYMMEKPKRRDEPILSKSVMRHILLNGAFTLALLLFFLRSPFVSNFYQNSKDLYTAFYALFIFAGLFNCLTARSERLWIFSNIGKNKPFLLILAFVSLIQILIIYFGGTLFRSTPLAATELLFAVLIGSSVLLFDMLRRVFEKLK